MDNEKLVLPEWIEHSTFNVTVLKDQKF